jgi:hypothetical protein
METAAQQQPKYAARVPESTAPAGKEYGPLEPWFDKSWKPGDFELVK